MYTVNDYENCGPIAAPVVRNIDNSFAWSPWYEYTGEVPVTEGVNNVSDVETKEESTEEVIYYKYRDKSTTTSYETSLAGWTQDGGAWVSQGQKSLKYVKSFPSGFYKSNSLYTKYHITPKSASETTTTKVVIDSDEVTDYIYWHWCYSHSMGEPINCIISETKGKKVGSYYTNHFHAFTRSKANALPYVSSANAHKLNDSDKCPYTYWWFRVSVRTQKYTTYNMRFNYYKWSDWSEASTTPVTATETREVITESIPGSTVKYYRYKTSSAINETNVSPGQIVNISGNAGTSFAGKSATVFVHKYAQPSDYTNEYIGSAVIDENGDISIQNAQLKEAPTAKTGDFTIVAAIEGNTGTVEIGKIEAPKPNYTVTFYDFDGTIIHTETVMQGGTVTAPAASDLHAPEGYKFASWDQSTVNVQDNLVVKPLSEKKTVVVVFIDWGNFDVAIQEVEYGGTIITPAAEGASDKTVTWDMSDATQVTDILEDNSTEIRYIATKNTVISTNYGDKIVKVRFIDPASVGPTGPDTLIDPIEFDEDDIIDEDDVIPGDNIVTPDNIEESPDYIFYGWKNIETGEYLTDTAATDNATYYPVYEFANTAELPEASIKTGEFDSTQTVALTCATDMSAIYYTTDGTDPQTSETAIEYVNPITISKSCTLQFCAMAFNMNNSSTVAEMYAINTTTAAVKYHIVTVQSNMQYTEGIVYQALIREGQLFNDSELEDFEGYTYDGLYRDAAYAEEFYVDSETVSETIELYAKYTPRQFTATFLDYNYEELLSSTADYGTIAVPPEDPTREGYVFVGWNSDAFKNITEDEIFTAQYVLESEYATVSLNRSKFSTMNGCSFTLKATVTPEELSDTELSWSSSDISIAEVDANGVVSFIGVGSVTVTVTVDSTGESADCIFTVSENANNKIVLGSNSYLGFDSAGYLREINTNSNTVAEVKSQFVNENLKFVDINGNELTNEDAVGTGTVISLMEDDSTIDSITVVVTGDTNGDGAINNRDAALATRYLVDKEAPDASQMIALDVNGDGNINNRDASMLSRYLVGKEII